MFSARWSLRAVTLLFVLGLCGLQSRAQAIRFFSLEARSISGTSEQRAGHACLGTSDPALASFSAESSRNDSLLAGCADSSIPPKLGTAHALPIAPCGASGNSATGCAPFTDAVRTDLAAMGKPGRKVLEAREKVLEILQSENACSTWFRTKDADPAATFRSVTFSLDSRGDVYVRKSKLPSGDNVFRSPYVARVLQGEGSQSTVTINTNGGFFFPLTSVVEQSFEGGPVTLRGSHALHVGPYAGGTQPAQVLALLHEFGHVIDLLPLDHDDYEGKSRQNTEEVLHFCREQIEAKLAPHTFLASQ